MPQKTTPDGRTYHVDGRMLTWPADVDTEAGEEPFEIKIPLRMKLKVLKPFIGQSNDDIGAMFEMLNAIIPNQSENLDEMDVADFESMFTAWNTEYTQLNGASLGEASGSSS